MTTPVLPAYITILFADYQQSRESALLRTQMESGPPRQVKIKSRIMTTIQARLYIDSNAEYQQFLTWYREEIQEGALFFQFIDPLTSTTIEGRFVDGGFVSVPLSSSMNKWEVRTSIEYWS